MSAPTTQTEPGSSTSVIELKDVSEELIRLSEEGRKSGANGTVLHNIRNDISVPDDAVEALQKWNEPRINMWRVLATYVAFFLFGMNDGAYGALIPYLEEYYNLSYTVVSLVFLSPFAGYTLAAAVNNPIHLKFGQRGIAVMASSCHVVAFVVFSVHPPYPVMVVLFVVVGFGNGLIDAAWCAWIGNMASGNQIMGIMHGLYALGATVSPLVATGMITKGNLKWYTFYYIMIGGSVIEFFTSTWAFWKQTGHVYVQENPRDPNATTGRTREALRNKLTWIFAFFVFAYVGAEVSLGGWIVSFMIKVRSASKFQSGASSTGFWAGMTVGRMALPYFTARLGEFKSVFLYLAITVALELIFWLVPNFIVSAIAVAFLGMSLGPLFPTSIVLMTKLLPRDLHVGSIGFATAFGGSGGAIFPFIIGAIAQHRGVKSLQPVIIALIVVQALLWFCLPFRGKKDEDVQENTEDSAITT